MDYCMFQDLIIVFIIICSIYQMFLGCVNDLTPEELPVCIPPEEQQIAFMVLPAVDNIVCSRVKRKAFSVILLLFEILL